MPFKNYEEKKKWARGWYSNHSKSVVEKVRLRKISVRKWIDEYKKNLKCTACPENHPATLDFHHKHDKKFAIAHIVANGYSPERIEKEISKCIILCSNCHRKLHYKNNKL